MEAKALTPQNIIASVAIVAGLVSGWTGSELFRSPTYSKPAADEVIRGLSLVTVQKQAELEACRAQEPAG